MMYIFQLDRSDVMQLPVHVPLCVLYDVAEMGIKRVPDYIQIFLYSFTVNSPFQNVSLPQCTLNPTA